jgi:hypothetical protein
MEEDEGRGWGRGVVAPDREPLRERSTRDKELFRTIGPKGRETAVVATSCLWDM